jgi:hypothetical protein
LSGGPKSPGVRTRTRPLAWTALWLGTAAALALLVSAPARSAPPVSADRIWFTPGPGTLDFQRLFEHPEEWSRARDVISVFKFYQQHTETRRPDIVGPNYYDALVRANAFRKLRELRINTALEIGSVKDFWCTPDRSGMDASIRATLDAVTAIENAGGTLKYIAMDEPWVSGRAEVCDGPALEPTANRVATYMSAVQNARPAIRIGLIEAYPFSSADAIETIVGLMRARGVPPAFLHVDVDRRALAAGAFAPDMKRLQAFARSQNITFGMIIWGYNGDADALYAVDAGALTNLIAEAFQTWEAMPEHLIFQSWAVSSGGLLITPSNLPENRAHTHTNLVFQLFRRLRGATGGPVGQATPRGAS